MIVSNLLSTSLCSSNEKSSGISSIRHESLGITSTGSGLGGSLLSELFELLEPVVLGAVAVAAITN